MLRAKYYEDNTNLSDRGGQIRGERVTKKGRLLRAEGQAGAWGDSSAADDNRVDLIFSLFQIQPSNLISKQNPI